MKGAVFSTAPLETNSSPCRAGRNPANGRSKSSLRSVEICGRGPQTMKPRNLFGFGASFTLAAIYSRGTCRPTTIDVLMFHFRVRNGTGWDHQAMTTRLLPYFVLPTLYFVLQFGWLSLLLGCLFTGGRLASAWLVCVFVAHLHSLFFRIKQKLLVTGVCIRSIGC